MTQDATSNTSAKAKEILSVVVPCYNEEPVLPETTRCLTALLNSMVAEDLISEQSFILYVNDGSKDKTWSIISQYCRDNQYVCGLNLAGNVGHQNALMAGLNSAVRYSDMIVSIDADLQDDVNAIREMVLRRREGFDIVYGVRSSRKTDTWFKRTTAQGFYKLMDFLGVKTVYNHADFRLLSRRALQGLLMFGERNLFLRGMVPLVGYPSTSVYYERAPRFAGESKYPLKKMLAFAFQGITSFSVKPVHYVLWLGILFLFISLGILLWVLYEWIEDKVVPGWSSMMLSIWFCSGCVLVGLGIVGEYIGKIYLEVKQRPLYIVAEELLDRRAK